ncbi:hypothetical protein J5N97_016163 [Dioscorea zingiberensis]|uniref:Glutathione S-transferase n=1 Tax=Dioscorea zingiberensis TaxID=325984 RepID=A0A9D5CKJ9_9LILI|nr:hypothetical protein J5N97_016163 [Dioscorea zingiberensis]
MASDDVKLIGAWASPYVMRPRIALNLKGVEYEFLEEKFGSKSELLLKSNPVYKKIPVLLHGGKPICESLIIVQYIDEAWSGHSILPSDPYHRAVARFWGHYIDDKWFPALTGISRAPTDEAKKEAIEQVFAGLKFLEEVLEKSGAGKPFFGGDTIGYIDIALGSHLGWLRATEKLSGLTYLDESKTPLLVCWAEKFSAHEAVKCVMPETDKLVEFAQMLKAKFSAPPSK